MNVRILLTSLGQSERNPSPPLSLICFNFSQNSLSFQKVLTMSTNVDFMLPNLDDLDGLTFTNILVAVDDIIY
ncbi:MAG: hypothetical protein ACI9QV_001114 [Methylophagaceae bacterium]|jgi:hypothetical protein